MIDVKKLYLKYIREYYALYDITLRVEKGESVALIGEEGSGKTTLLRVLAKLEKFDKGEAYIKDISIKKINFKEDVSLGYISTKPVFLEHKSVYENLKFVLKNRNVPEKEIEQKVNETIIEYNLEKYRDTKACDLSLYEKYMISIIRLTLRPLEILMVDDIFENLDKEQSKVIIEFIKQMFIDKQVTNLVASSNQDLLGGVCQRFVYFKNGSIE